MKTMESSAFAAPKIVVVAAEEAQEVIRCVLAVILKIILKNITLRCTWLSELGLPTTLFVMSNAD